jgi:hypothetical protein
MSNSNARPEVREIGHLTLVVDRDSLVVEIRPVVAEAA